MKRNKFEIGDIIKGLNDDEKIVMKDMLKALVTDVYKDKMRIKVLNHINYEYINNSFWVDNDVSHYELISNINSFDMSVYVQDNKLIVHNNFDDTEVVTEITKEMLEAHVLTDSIVELLKDVDTNKLICDTPKYSGKVIAVSMARGVEWTRGKVYKFEDGLTTLDNGATYPPVPAKTFEDVTNFTGMQLIEVVED